MKANLFIGLASLQSLLSKAESVIIDSHACSYRNESSCWFASEQMVNSFCGGFCRESQTCVDYDVQECPLGESFKRPLPQILIFVEIASGNYGLLPCERLPAPECTAARTEKISYAVCRGFCVPKKGTDTNELDWSKGVCTSIGHSCKDTLVTSLDDVPCHARTSCFSCFFTKWGSLDKADGSSDLRKTGAPAAGPDCQWCPTSSQCVTRDTTCANADETALPHHGYCPDETKK